MSASEREESKRERERDREETEASGAFDDRVRGRVGGRDLKEGRKKHSSGSFRQLSCLTRGQDEGEIRLLCNSILA